MILEKHLKISYYLLLIEKKSDETIRSTCFAVKFYLNIIKKDSSQIQSVLDNLPNIKREKKLPIILSKEEIEKLISVTKNINHRLIIQICYSAGLRVNEIINLKWQDIDFDRNLIHLKRAKGKKDRIVMLSQKVKEGFTTLSQEKSGYVFQTNKGGKYTQRTIQKIMETPQIKQASEKR